MIIIARWKRVPGQWGKAKLLLICGLGLFNKQFPN